MNFIVNPYEGRDDRDMLEESLADIFPEYYQNEAAIEAAVEELTNYLKNQTEDYNNKLSSAKYPKDYYFYVPFAQYPFPTAEATIANSPYFSQKGKLSKFFNYITVFDMWFRQDTSPDNLRPRLACDPQAFFANEKNSFVDFFRNCYTGSYGIPTMKGKYKDYEDMSIEDSSRDWIVSEPISQAILARYLKEFSSPPAERPTMLDYYYLLGFANMLASQSGHIITKMKNDLNISGERSIESWYGDCQYALDKFEEYKNHLKQGNSEGGILALKKLIEVSGFNCLSEFWNHQERMDNVEKWEKDYLSLFVRYLYGQKHNQVRRVIDITAANAHILMKALIYVDRYYGSDSKPEQPLPPEMERIISPILEKITGEFLKWDDFASIFSGNTLTTENINKEGDNRNYTYEEMKEDWNRGPIEMGTLYPIENGIHYYAKNGFDNAWEDTKKQGRAALGMLQYLSPSFYISGEASKTDEDYAQEAAAEFFSARTAHFVSGLLELQKPLNPAHLGDISLRRPIYYWLDINFTELCSIGTENHPNTAAINNESCAIVDRAILEFQGAKGEYYRRTNKFVHSTDWARQHIKHNVDFYLSAGEFARDLIVDGVVDYVLGLGFAKLAKFVNARKAANAAKAATKVNSSTGNVVKVPNKSYVPKNKPTGKGGSRARSGENRNGNSTLRDKRNNARNRQKATGGNPTPSTKKPYVPPSVKRGVEHIKGDWYKVNFGDGNSIRVKLKEGQKIELLDNGHFVIKDATGHPVHDFPNFSEFKKCFTQAADGSWVFSQASVDAQGGFGKLLKENGHLFGDPENYKELGEVVANDQSNFRRLFKDNESAKLANELVGNGQYEELGKLVDDAVTPFRYKSPASDMADDIRYLSMKLEKTPDGIKGSSVVEIPLGEISQWDKASDFLKSNTQSYELMDEFELSDYNKKQIEKATANKNGKYQINLKNKNGKGIQESIGQLEYNQLKRLAEQKGGRFVMLKKNDWDEMCEVAKKLDEEIITPHLKQKSGVSGWDSEATYIRGGYHEYGPGGKTDYVFLKVEDGTQHIHIEKKINFELNGKTYTTIYNVNVPIKIESDVMQGIFKNTPNAIGLLQLIFLSGVSVAGMGEASDELYQEP